MRSVNVTEISPDTQLIDVREVDEFVSGHTPGAINIPMGEIGEHLGELTTTEGDIYIMCERGGRSAKVCEYLVQQGVDPINVDGGMEAWRAAGLPQEMGQ